MSDDDHGAPAYAARPDDELVTVADRGDMRPIEAVRLALGTSTADVWARLQSGHLDAVVVAGRAFVPQAQVDALVLASARAEVDNTMRQVGPARDALLAYLAAHPAVGALDVAMDRGVPLVTSYRSGEDNYRVLVQVRALGAWIADRLAEDEVATFRDSSRASWRRIPAGAALVRTLCAMDGVEVQSNATGLLDPARRARRIYGWVRCDPRAFRPVLESDVADALGAHDPEKRFAAAAPVPATFDERPDGAADVAQAPMASDPWDDAR